MTSGNSGQTSSAGPDDSNVGMIVGIVVGCVVLIIIIIVIIVVVRMRKKKSEEDTCKLIYTHHFFLQTSHNFLMGEIKSSFTADLTNQRGKVDKSLIKIYPLVVGEI